MPIQIQGYPSYPIINSNLTPTQPGGLIAGQKVLLAFANTAFQLINYSNPALLPIVSGNFYCSATGSDVTGDGSQSNPWRDIPHAVSVVANNIALSQVTINCGPGNYTGIQMPDSFIASWLFQGSGVNNCNLASAPNQISRGRALVSVDDEITIDGFRVSSEYEGLATNRSSGTMIILNVDFTMPTTAGYSPISAHYGEILILGTCNFFAATGGGVPAAFIEADSGAKIIVGRHDNYTNNPVTLNFGNVDATANFIAEENGTISLAVPPTVTFVGGTTNPKYECTYGGGIAAGGTVIPGTPGDITGGGGPGAAGWYRA